MAGGYRLSRFMDPSKYQDTYDEGAESYSLTSESRPLYVGPRRCFRGTVKQCYLRIDYDDSDGLTVTIVTDKGRVSSANPVVIKRVSGMAANTAIRQFLNLYSREGLFGYHFTTTIVKVVPTDGDVEIKGFVLIAIPVGGDQPVIEHTAGTGDATGDIEFVVEADAVPEVNAYA